MAEFDVDSFIARFRDRAEAVRTRPLPPVAGDERRKLIQQAEIDFMDYSIVGNATWSLEGEHLVIRLPLA
jgi:hypothetical protein